ncbi:DUF5953 family protein [Corallococcus interemptor]|uniref:DUF5953 family protein n=1 Tax=Corallococcus interemptor TaxID=2316720 RepID=UPI003D07007A
MPPSRNTLVIRVHVPAHPGDERCLIAAAHGLEHVVPGLRLAWTVSDEQELVPLPERDEWLARLRRDRGVPFICNNDEGAPMTMSALDGPGPKPLLDIHAKLPLDAEILALAAKALEAMAVGARALWGHATPFEAAAEISRQTVHPVHKPQVPPRGLPALKFPQELRSPEIPHRLGWLNYWSDATARIIGFPDPERDANLLSRSRRLSSGGWLVQLTDALLTLDNPAHLDALLRAYERFPVIGGRTEP